MKLNRWLLLILLTACAPEPTDPAETSLAGVWTANANLYTYSQLRMNIVQEPQGIVSGTWTAKRAGANANGDIIGRNTVSQVEIELLSAGKFEGALLELNRLRGIFAVGESFDTITFVRQ